VILALPHKAIREYLRDFQIGTLEKNCPEICPLCQAPICLFAYRERKVLRIHVLRGRCKGARVHHFTFLPVFVAPGKWYGYETIEESLVFINQERFPNKTAAFNAWEEARENRIEDRIPPGPSSKTVGRWHSELVQDRPERPWKARAEQAILEISSHRNLGHPGKNRQKPKTPGDFSVLLLSILLTLGKALLGNSRPIPSVSVLGIGIWFLESRFKQRCLARFELVGNIVVGPVPDMSVTKIFLRGYPPFS
jgi:hypothetical protein